MNTNPIFCVITYPDDEIAKAHLLRSLVSNKYGQILDFLGFTPKDNTADIFATSSSSAYGHGYVSIRKTHITLYDNDRPVSEAVPYTEFKLRPEQVPVIHIDSNITALNEYMVSLYAGTDDRMHLCTFRAVSTTEASSLRILMNRFLCDNNYKKYTNGVYILTPPKAKKKRTAKII